MRADFLSGSAFSYFLGLFSVFLSFFFIWIVRDQLRFILEGMRIVSRISARAFRCAAGFAGKDFISLVFYFYPGVFFFYLFLESLSVIVR